MCTNCTLFLMGAVPWCYLCSTFEPNCMTTMKRMLNRMLRYADAIVKRGVDKLIDAIGHTPEPQTKNTEKPQPQKSKSNDTDGAPQATGHTTNGGLTEQTSALWTNCATFAIMCLTAHPKCNGVTRRTKETFTAVALGRELVQQQVPRRRSSKAI